MVSRSVGVSNFDVQHLEGLKDAGMPLPSVNQIELNPFFRQKELVEYCRRENIPVMGYSPLAKGTAITDPTMKAIAKKLGRNTTLVMLSQYLHHYHAATRNRLGKS
jgi:diketogulonate reductase-like aldo/keto reductase